MTAPAYTKQKLLKQFSALGPYIREEQSSENHYFFDCLAVCVNVKIAPEKREFWGWWLTLDKQPSGHEFHYCYRLGMYDKVGKWQEMPINMVDMRQKVLATLLGFHERLQKLAGGLGISLAEDAESEPLTVEFGTK